MCGWTKERRFPNRRLTESAFGKHPSLIFDARRTPLQKDMKIAPCFVVILCAAATSLLAADELALRLQPALEAITPDGLLAHIKILASDEFEGRAPGTKGEELSVKYISDQFKQIGLKPGNPDGSYVQEVPLAGIKSEPTMSFTVGDKTTELKYPDDFVASSARLQSEIKVNNSDVVFVGYGIIAPEYGWDDYKDADVRGKTILMLINDPAIPDPKDPSKLDDKMFKGKAMTYYGRWTYKYEIAAQKGAAAAIIIHETEPAAYPWQVVRSSWGKENFELDNPNKNMDAVSARSWITRDVAKKLFADCGQDFDALKKSAVAKEFRPVALNAKADSEIKQEIRSFKSHNVIGNLEDLTNSNSTLDDLLGQAAARQGRAMKPNSEPEKGGFYRVDSFEFAKVGVPVLHAARGIDIIGKPPDYGKQKRDEFVVKHYHQPSDEVDPTWDLSGAVQDVQLLFEVGYQIANGDKFPEWKAGTEFKAKRDAMLKK